MKSVNSALVLIVAGLTLGNAVYAAEEKSGGQPGSRSETTEARGDRDEMMCGPMHGGARRGHEGYADMVLGHAYKLKLSDEQMGKILRIHMENRKKLRDLFGKLRDSMKSAYKSFLNPADDESTVRKDAKEHSTVFDQIVDAALQDRNAVNAVLTPEQLKQLKSIKSES
jgi:Spy/CpxP family protein refolding chaperone